MAILIEWTGEEAVVLPADPEQGFTLGELYTLIGCEIVEVVSLADGRLMVIDEEGRLNKSPLNVTATRLFMVGRGTGYAIVGNVVVAQPGEVQ